ncbi:MAG: tail fiber domain-containing protein [Legionellales bacterium]|jgi:hypothetical protein
MIQDNFKNYYSDRFGHGTSINHIIDELSVLGMDRQYTTGLDWYYHGGVVRFGVTTVTIASGFLTLANNAVNYIYVTPAGAVSSNTTGVVIPNYIIAEITTAAGAITIYADKRTFLNNDIAVPAGSDKEIQFNDGGVFGADSLFVWDKTNNRLGVGINVPTHKLHVSDDATTQVCFESYVDSSSSPRLIFRKARGTMASATATLSGDSIGVIYGRGHTGTSFSTGNDTYIILSAAENFSTTAKGTQIAFYTTVKTTTTNSQGMILNHNGNLLIGNSTDGWKFRVAPTANTTAGQTAFIQDGTATTGSTKIVIKSGAGQSTNTLEEWQDVSANIMASMSQTVFTSPATLKLKNAAKYNSFTNSGSQADGTLAYTLPSAYPAVTGYALLSTDAGVMSWGAVLSNPMTTTGDIIYSSDNSGTPARLGATTDGYVLTLASGIPTWASGGGGGSSPFTEDGTTYSIRRTNESTAGNTRGTDAIDLVHTRAIAAQVAAANYSGILSGLNHQNDGLRSTITGGYANRINTAYSGSGNYDGNSFVGGGYNNFIGTNHICNTIGGGTNNNINASAGITYSEMNTISGGYNNAIIGGTANIVDSHTIGGGYSNSITGHNSCTISGGQSNVIVDGASFSTIGGGLSNVIINGGYGCIPGGRANSAGVYSFAAGYNATATLNSFCWADGTATATNNQYQFKVGADGGFYLRNNSGNFNWWGQTVGGVAMWMTSPNAAAYWGADGVWYNPSSRELKTNFKKSDTKDILKKVIDVNIDEWEYKEHQGTKHIGIMAQDFNELFGYGNTPESLNTMDVCGVLWAAVQELSKQVTELKAKIN